MAKTISMQSVTLVAVLLSVATASALTACAAPGGSRASADTQKQTTDMILSFDNIFDKKCKDKKIVEQKFEKRYGESGGNPNGWTELWSLDRCGKRVPYRVNYELRFGNGRVIVSPTEEKLDDKQYIELLAVKNRCDINGEASAIGYDGGLIKYRMPCGNGDMVFQCDPAKKSDIAISNCWRLD